MISVENVDFNLSIVNITRLLILFMLTANFTVVFDIPELYFKFQNLKILG